jgi:PEP-CTERM motif
VTFTKFLLASIATVAITAGANATPFTKTSPTGGALPVAVTEVGGIVLDLKGLNNNRVVSQLSAASLYVGFASSNPQVIGTQTGFSPAVLAALGGGLQSASVRVTLFDGDTAPGNFDDGDNNFFLDGINFGNWSSVSTQRTSNDGLTLLSSGTGFGNNILSTGFFSTNNAGLLASLFTNLGDGSLVYSLDDVDPFDNFYDFTQGVAGGLVNVGQPPVVNPGIPEPSTWAMLIAGFGLVGGMMRRRAGTAVVAS